MGWVIFDSKETLQAGYKSVIIKYLTWYSSAIWKLKAEVLDGDRCGF